MAPLWTYGFHQSRERYATQSELLEVVDKYRDLKIPYDGIVQDWEYWGNPYLWNAMEFLAEGFPEPQKMIDHVHDQNAHISVSVWQSFGIGTKPYRELARKGHLLDFETFPPSGLPGWPPRDDYPSGSRVYDAYSAEARDIYWKISHVSTVWVLIAGGWTLPTPISITKTTATLMCQRRSDHCDRCAMHILL